MIQTNPLFTYLSRKHLFFTALTVISMILPGAAQENTTPDLGPNLLHNPGFEIGIDGWRGIPEAQAEIVSNQRRSGAHSLHYTNNDAGKYHLFTSPVHLSPGSKVHFSAWVKGKDIVPGGPGSNGAGVYIESYAAREQYIAGAYPRALSGTFDWTQVKGEYIVPPSAQSTSVGLYFQRSSTGTVWFDDIELRVEQSVGFNSLLVYPNYRGTVLQGDATPWKYEVNISPASSWEQKPVRIATVLTDSANKAVISRQDDVPANQKKTSLTFEAPKNLPLGKYALQQRITDPDGKTHTVHEETIHIVQEMPKVHIDREGFTVVNGKRFFPLGLYMLGQTDDENLQRIAQGGFNSILAYNYGWGKDPEAFLDSAEKHNLKVAYSIASFYAGYDGQPKNEQDIADGLVVARDYIQRIRSKPALLTWYTADEPEISWLPRVGNMYRLVKELDKSHPVFQVIDQVGIMNEFYDTTDILASDPYPVSNSDKLTQTSSSTRITAEAARGSKGVWMVPQLMDWALYRPTYKPHHPSLDEMRNQAYQSIINGATGLFFYSYFDLFYEKYPKSPATRNEAIFTQRWHDVTTMAREVNGIIPAILHGSPKALSSPPHAEIEVKAIEYQDELLLLLANPFYQEKEISMEMPRGYLLVTNDAKGINSFVENGIVTLKLQAIASGTLRFKKN